MNLDINTMFVVTIAVTAILGFLLIYAWHQNRHVRALAWWGSAHMIASGAVWLIGSRAAFSDFWAIEIANALLFLSAGMIWAGARLFDGNRVSLIGVFGGAAAWLIAGRVTGFMATIDGPVILSSTIIACYSFATAIEFWRGRHDGLLSRLPLVVMLSTHGAFYLVRSPFGLIPAGEGNDPFFSTAWFGIIGLESLLYMIATAFILLALVKERMELERKMAAMIDPLTGLADRRGFLSAAAQRLRKRMRQPQPVSALLFDLDGFKAIVEAHGETVGERLLRSFSKLARAEIASTDLLGRLEGEKFGALLFGADAGAAAATAERIRVAFATHNGAVDGRRVDATVSAGAASVPAHKIAEIETLLTRCAPPLHAAKVRGGNRVEVAESYSPQSAPAPRSEHEASATGALRLEPSLAPMSLAFAEGENSGAMVQPVGDGLHPKAAVQTGG